MKRQVPTGEWELVCSGEVFARMRTDEEFAFLLTLSRVLNALKFGVETHRAGGVERTPVAERRRVGAFLYLASALHETLQLKKAGEARWGKLPVFVEVFAVFDETQLDQETIRLLNRIRNRASFHFDPTLAGRALADLPDEPFAFLTATGRDPMNSNYELADLITFGFVFEAVGNVKKLAAGLNTFRPILDSLLSRFISNSDRILVRRLLAIGFEIVDRPQGSFHDDREPDQS
jgi:hypothetical protein